MSEDRIDIAQSETALTTEALVQAVGEQLSDWEGRELAQFVSRAP